MSALLSRSNEHASTIVPCQQEPPTSAPVLKKRAWGLEDCDRVRRRWVPSWRLARSTRDFAPRSASGERFVLGTCLEVLDHMI